MAGGGNIEGNHVAIVDYAGRAGPAVFGSLTGTPTGAT